MDIIVRLKNVALNAQAQPSHLYEEAFTIPDSRSSSSSSTWRTSLRFDLDGFFERSLRPMLQPRRVAPCSSTHQKIQYRSIRRARVAI